MDQNYIDVIIILATQLIPVLSSFVVDADEKNTNKIRVSIVASVVLAVLRAFTAGEYDPAVLVGTALAAFVAQLGAYQGYWKEFRLNERAQMIRFPQHRYSGPE